VGDKSDSFTDKWNCVLLVDRLLLPPGSLLHKFLYNIHLLVKCKIRSWSVEIVCTWCWLYEKFQLWTTPLKQIYSKSKCWYIKSLNCNSTWFLWAPAITDYFLLRKKYFITASWIFPECYTIWHDRLTISVQSILSVKVRSLKEIKVMNPLSGKHLKNEKMLLKL
jgi:hypothetical protein